MDNGSDRERILESFLRLEKDFDLFSVKLRGIYPWERLRLSTYRKILVHKGVTGQSHPGDNRSRFQRYSAMFKNVFVKNPFLASQHDILFLGHPRRKKENDGHWWDLYCDPITTELDLDYLHAERPSKYRNEPVRTENIRYLDIIYNSISVPWGLGLLDVSFTPSERQKIQYISGALESEFGVSVDIEGNMETILIKQHRKRLYKIFLRRVNPEIAVVVVGYTNHVWIEACDELDIPVVELQHGLIHDSHLAYHFPEGVEANTFPDYIFTFGQYWCDCVNYPIEDDRVIPAGYPYLEMKSEEYSDVKKRDQIIFISQGTVGEDLSKFAVEVGSMVNDHDIVYKLHPGEYDIWKEEYPWLENSGLRVVDSDEPPLYRLFAESKVQVGVYSTAIYEGLKFDLDTYLMEAPGMSVMNNLIEAGAASVVSSVDELEDELSRKGDDETSGLDTDYFFAPNPLENISAALNEIGGDDC